MNFGKTYKMAGLLPVDKLQVKSGEESSCHIATDECI